MSLLRKQTRGGITCRSAKCNSCGSAECHGEELKKTVWKKSKPARWPHQEPDRRVCEYMTYRQATRFTESTQCFTFTREKASRMRTENFSQPISSKSMFFSTGVGKRGVILNSALSFIQANMVFLWGPSKTRSPHVPVKWVSKGSMVKYTYSFHVDESGAFYTAGRQSCLVLPFFNGASPLPARPSKARSYHHLSDACNCASVGETQMEQPTTSNKQ